MISTGICRWLFLLISLSTWTRLIDSKEMRVVCYYTNWSVYRPGQAKFSPQNINPYLCTHLIYAFGGFTKENTLKPFDKYQDIEKGGYAKFTGLKTYNKNLKTMIAIGGWNEGSSRFSSMVANSERRKQLVKNTIKFLRQNHFDGLDLDWEYPTFRDGGKPRDRDNYAHLVQELREEFERESEKTGRPRLLLTMAVPAGIEYINKGYDVPKLTKYLDWMNILSYDYHSAFEPAVNHHAPLFSLEEDNEYNYDAELNIDYTIKHYMKLGAEPNKLVLGIPTYGRSYTLFNPDAFEIGSPADGPGDMGEATRENGYLAYYEICENVKNQDWEVDEPNPDAMGPIAFKDNQWVGYDDENIVRKKAEYVAENSLGGIMFWAIDNDDFRGNCHGKPYPLIEAGKEALLNAYGLTEDNLISPPSKPTKASKSKSRTRTSKTTTTEKPEEISVSVSPTRRRRIKSKSRDEDSSSAQSAKRRKDSSRKSEGTSTYSSLKVITPAYTTPAPPATPDMGGAFKCEDEGFYPHPKDCKKYFWCLGGPGDSGIVAHQFTCPAGLFFNKAADSCDYSQNVLCNKKLQKATSTTTQKSEPSTTESTTSQKPTPSSVFSTSRIPPKITSAIGKSTFNFRTTTTTTTEAYEDEDEYEDDEEEPDKKEESEEDPKVIKELIDLIRKAGGIEELEKQLKFGKEGSVATSTSDVTTPSGISKSLYERVLSKTSKNSLSALKKPSFNRNSGGPQGNGAEESKEKKLDKGRLQYRTLTRQRPSAEKSTDTKAEEEEKEEPRQKTSFRTKSTLEYVNIRRPKTSSTTESNDDDGFGRNKILGELDDEPDDEDEEENTEDIDEVRKKNNVPKYVNIRRPRPSTTEASAASSKYQLIRRSTVSPIEAEAEEDQEEKKYKTIRRGSTTESSPTSEEPTSLRYQTIRRGITTTTTPTSIPEEDDRAVRRRSTTASTTTTTTDGSTEPKLLSIRRSTTAAPIEEQNESSAKYQTVKRDSTTQPTFPTSERASSTESTEKEATENITENDLAGTTLPQESISNINTITTENLISSTHKETTESNTDAPSSTSSTTLAGSLSETTEPETKQKRPVLFQPRPFSVGTSSTAKSTTPEPTTTVTSKVSQTNLKYRLRTNSSSSTTTESPNSNTVRSRSRTRYSNANKNLSEDTEQEEKYERTVENKPVRARKRLLITTTEIPIDSSEDSKRKYRPAELADLSSLTAVDLNIRGGEFISNNRRRRPVVTTSSTTTTAKPLTESEKTGSKTLTIARKTIDINSFGKSRRIAPTTDDQLNASSDQTSTTRKIVRGFRSTTPKAFTQEPASSIVASESTKTPARTRKIIRRFRPGSSSTTPTSEKPAENDAVITSTTPSTPGLLRKRIPLFRSRQNKANLTASVQTNLTTESLEIASTTTESPLLKLFKTRSRFDISRNDSVSNEEEEEEDEISNEHTDVLNGEEGENIKLSESNIRESSQINSFGFNDKPHKQKFGRPKETTLSKPSIQKQPETPNNKVETTTDISENNDDNSQLNLKTRTEPTRIIRTRKIIRKVNTTTTTEAPTTTIIPDLSTSNNFGTKRKILRRLRPSNSNKLDVKPEEKNDQSTTRKNIFRGQISTESTSTVPLEEITEEIKSKKFFHPNLKIKNNTKTEITEEKTKYEPNKFRVFKPTTDNYSPVSSPRYSLYSRSTLPDFVSDIDENDDTDESDDDEDDDDENDEQIDDIDEDIIDGEDENRNLDEDGIPKYTIYTTSSIERTHKFESNTNFNDEDEDFGNNLKANKSISSLILKTALNSRKESKTILDETNGEELEDEGGKSNKQKNVTTIIKVNNLLRPQKDETPVIEQQLTLGKEEVKTQIQQDLLKTQHDHGTTTIPTTGSSDEYSSTVKPKSTILPDPDTTTYVSDTATEVNNLENASSPISETTENIDSTTLVINSPVHENNKNIGTNDILFTTTEEFKGTTLKHVTDEPIEITHPDEMDETTTELESEDVTSTNTDIPTVTSNPDVEESTKSIISNLTESTTEYHRRSTLRSVKDRPKLGFKRKIAEPTNFPSISGKTTDNSTKKTFTRTFGKNRLKTSTTKPRNQPPSLGRTRSTSPLPLNKLLYRYSTTDRSKFNKEEPTDELDNEGIDEPENDENDHQEEEEEDKVSTQSTKPILSRSSTTPRIINEPIESSKLKNTFNKPKFIKISSTTESVPLEELGVDTEAVRNRNKNLFSKRKMNTPFVSSSSTPGYTSPSSENSEITTTQSPISTESTDPSLTTLHHVFAEVDGGDTTTESMISSPSTNSGKVERLIEVNRIVEVKTKQAKVKNHAGAVEVDTKIEKTPTLDKIGEISRVTLIKIVDGSNETLNKDPESNEISTSLDTPSSSPVYVSENVKGAVEVAKVEEIPASKIIQNVNLKNIQLDIKMNSEGTNGEREERKFEIFGESKVANDKELTNLAGKPEIIDGISHINVVTPKPLLVTEASTISLQGLFQTEKPHLNPSFTSNDEGLETGRSEFVNVRILDQDTGVRLDNGWKGSSSFVPVRVLRQDEEESTIKAHVMEISPKPNSRTIKIVPIRVEMSRNLASVKLPPKPNGLKT